RDELGKPTDAGFICLWDFYQFHDQLLPLLTGRSVETGDAYSRASDDAICVRHRLDRLSMQHRPELRSRGDSELREDPVQVGADRPVGQVEPLADLACGQAFGRELRDVQLVRGQLIADVGTAAWASLARRP